MKPVLLLAMLLVNPVAAQKVVRKIGTLPFANLLRIDAAQCYSVELETAALEVMEVEATMEGEYGSDIVLKLGQEGGGCSLFDVSRLVEVSTRTADICGKPRGHYPRREPLRGGSSKSDPCRGGPLQPPDNLG